MNRIHLWSKRQDKFSAFDKDVERILSKRWTFHFEKVKEIESISNFIYMYGFLQVSSANNSSSRWTKPAGNRSESFGNYCQEWLLPGLPTHLINAGVSPAIPPISKWLESNWCLMCRGTWQPDNPTQAPYVPCVHFREKHYFFFCLN